MKEMAAGLYTGHTGWVRSVAFAPNGQHIISGSSDGLIRVWNAEMGETAAGPFTGHTALFMSVQFLPDGQQIVLGSSDESIRVWNAKPGETAAGPFTGHVAANNRRHAVGIGIGFAAFPKFWEVFAAVCKI
jgi:WD40 repeat protein